MENITINSSRLINFINEMALIGATPNGGCNRQALTKEDELGRKLFKNWCDDIGGICRLDSMGNLFVRFEGKDIHQEPILMSSHLDTQPLGGKYDGVYGVLAALEVMYTLHDNNIILNDPIEIVVWANEEGARFSPAMSGSGVFSGQLTQETIYNSLDSNGITFYQALKETHQLGNIKCQKFPFKAALELHIEQGPILEKEEKEIGIVQGIQGMNWYEVFITGESTHAGPTPMSMRKDPVQCFYQLINAIYTKVLEFGNDARITIGKISTIPASPNTVPQQVYFTLDIRHPEQNQLNLIEKEINQLCIQYNDNYIVEMKSLWKSPAIKFSDKCINSIETACNNLSIKSMPIVSGAGHDSAYLSYIGNTGMIFIPCTNGVSHNEKEHVEDKFLITGANVLLHSVLNLAN